MVYFNFHHHHLGEMGIFSLDKFEVIENQYFSVGIHPKDITMSDFEVSFQKLKKISLHSKCLAIGECGLDSMVEALAFEQEKIFLEQILWANTIKKPVIIHCVRRFPELIKFKKWAKTPLIIHGFNKKGQLGNQLLQSGFYFSFGKALLYNVYLQDMVKSFPLDKMFLETDDAEINIEEIYHKMAELRQISMVSLQNQITQNLNKIGIKVNI